MTDKKHRFTLRKKITIGIIVGVMILGAATAIFTCEAYRSSLVNQLIESATGIANAIAAQVDPDSIDKYLETNKTDSQYYETRDDIRKIVENTGVEYAVVTKPTEEGFYYVYDSDTSDEAFKLGDFQEYYEGAFLDNKENFLEGNEIEPIITDYEFGWLLSVVVPIRNAAGETKGYVDLDMSMDEIVGMITNFVISAVIILTIILVILAIVAEIYVNNKLVKPINKLAEATGNFVSDDNLSIHNNGVIELDGMNTGDEIEGLYCSVKKMEEDIYKYIDNLTAVTAEKERIGAELNVATKIQEDMLPSIFPPFPDKKNLDIYATMNPAKEVGGDFYDFYMIDDEHLVLVMADVSGKGVPAALVMVISKTILKYRAQAGGNLDDVMAYVNNKLCESNDYQFFVTCWISVINIRTGEAVSVNAGHEKPAIKRKNGKYELISTKHGLPLAAMEGSKYRCNEYKLEAGDKVFVYTDGVTEATNANKELFGEERLIEALNSNSDGSSKETIETVKAAIDKFVGDAPQFDDITMLSFTIEEG